MTLCACMCVFNCVYLSFFSPDYVTLIVVQIWRSALSNRLMFAGRERVLLSINLRKRNVMLDILISDKAAMASAPSPAGSWMGRAAGLWGTALASGCPTESQSCRDLPPFLASCCNEGHFLYPISRGRKIKSKRSSWHASCELAQLLPHRLKALLWEGPTETPRWQSAANATLQPPATRPPGFAQLWCELPRCHWAWEIAHLGRSELITHLFYPIMIYLLS